MIAAEEGADAFVAWAKRNATELRSVESRADDSDLQPLRKIVDDASVVALGEPAHGAHEPLALRNRIAKYLVEHCGFTAIALETSFTEARAVSDYVAGGAGNAADIVREHFSWGFGRFTENVELVEWMRAYNASATSNRKVAFYGIDLTGGDNKGGFSKSRIALDAVLGFLKAHDEAGSRDFRAVIEARLADFSEIGYQRVTPAQDAALDKALAALASYLKQEEIRLVRSASPSEYAWTVRNLALAQELQKLFRLSPAIADTIRSGDWRMVEIRDAAMAGNVQWVLEQGGAGARVLVFAHNGHIMNASSRGGIWSAFAVAPRMMGQHLRATLGDRLRIVGVIAAENDMALPRGPVIARSAEESFARIGVPLLLLDLRDAGGDAPSSKWLSRERPIRANFNSQMDLTLATAFDALVYLDLLTPGHRVSR